MQHPVGIPLSREIRVTGLVSAFHTHFAADFRYEGEKHDGWEFVYVESGRIRAKADDNVYILKSGEMVCHKPQEFHSIQPYHGPADVIIFCFDCSGEKMRFFNNKILFINQRQKQYLNDIAIGAGEVFTPKDPLEIGRDGHMDRSPEATPLQEQFLKNTIELLILSLLSADSTERQKRVESYALHLQRKSLTSDIIAYLRENMAGKVLLTDISKQVSYSPSSIKRIFNEEMGCSIMQYLCDLRIERAKELLGGTKKVTEIAQEIGFDTANYFSAVFKKRTGMTPSEYRESIGVTVEED